MQNSTVKLLIENNIAHVILSRPEKLNAINKEMFFDLVAVMKKLKANKKIRAIIVSGEGENFSSGLDVKSVLKNPALAVRFLAKLFPWQSNIAQKLSTGWRKIPVPVIMAIHGRCWGGGLQIALGADFRIATPEASLSIMEGRWGLIPDMGGTLALREVLRQDVAKELAMTSRIVTGSEALQLGLITHVADDPLLKAQALATLISEQSPDATAAIKKLYNKSWWSSAGMALARESWYQVRVILGKNYKIKGYNQTHDESEKKQFLDRKNW